MKTSNDCFLALAIFLACSLAACSSLRLGNPRLAPNPPASAFFALTPKGDFTGEAHGQQPIGELSVIFLKLRNDTERPQSIFLSRIVGVTHDQQRISLIPPGNAAYQTAAADKQSIGARMATGLAVGALGGAMAGGAAGAIAGAALGPPGVAAGAAILAAVGGGTGAIVGALSGAFNSNKGESAEAANPIFNRRLSDQVIMKASQAEGYIFLPADNYSRISVIVSSDTGAEQEISIPIASTT